jgi:hypothetical protein
MRAASITFAILHGRDIARRSNALIGGRLGLPPSRPNDQTA